MKNCDRCEHYFDKLRRGSPCGKCIDTKWGDGFQRAKTGTRLRIIFRRIARLLGR